MCRSQSCSSVPQRHLRKRWHRFKSDLALAAWFGRQTLFFGGHLTFAIGGGGRCGNVSKYRPSKIGGKIHESWDHLFSVGLALLGKCRSGRPASPNSVGWWLKKPKKSFVGFVSFLVANLWLLNTMWGRWRFWQGRHFGAQRAGLEVWTVCWSPGVQGLLS